LRAATYLSNGTSAGAVSVETVKGCSAQPFFAERATTGSKASALCCAGTVSVAERRVTTAPASPKQTSPAGISIVAGAGAELRTAIVS